VQAKTTIYDIAKTMGNLGTSIVFTEKKLNSGHAYTIMLKLLFGEKFS
jgi:hypothetical protein